MACGSEGHRTAEGRRGLLMGERGPLRAFENKTGRQQRVEEDCIDEGRPLRAFENKTLRHWTAEGEMRAEWKSNRNSGEDRKGQERIIEGSAELTQTSAVRLDCPLKS